VVVAAAVAAVAAACKRRGGSSLRKCLGVALEDIFKQPLLRSAGVSADQWRTAVRESATDAEPNNQAALDQARVRLNRSGK
jgi:hypothetical protein